MLSGNYLESQWWLFRFFFSWGEVVRDMRDTVRIWRRLLGRTYDAVNTNGPAQNVEECPVNAPGNILCRFVKGKYNSKFGGV